MVVEKLTSRNSCKIETRQDTLQTIFFDLLDIFHSPVYEPNFEQADLYLSMICVSVVLLISLVFFGSLFPVGWLAFTLQARGCTRAREF